jgi:RNA polymerase sigma factor (sigma-70 family)
MATEDRARTLLEHRSRILLGHIQWLFAKGTVSGLSESQLLARFVADRDEVAFEAIVSRHGPMVLGVCRRLLDDPHDVEDGFQATFLVLVRKAGALTDRELLANWLYGVALRVATRLRRDRTRRRVRERTDVRGDVAAPADDGTCGELPFLLDQEIARLPARFRAPIVLCYFEGLTHDQAAEHLGCPVGTIRSRMAKGRELLRSRLTQRGYAPVSSLGAFFPLARSAPAVPPALFMRTIAAAAGVAADRSIGLGATSTAVVTLVKGVLPAMSITRWITLAAVLVILGVAGSSVRVAARQHRTEPTKVAVPGAAPADRVRPTREALAELERTISEHEKQLKSSRDQISLLRVDLGELMSKVQELEAKVKTEAAKGTASGRVISENTAANPAGSDMRVFRAEVPSTDYVVRSPHLIVSQAASNDHVVIFSIGSGRSRTYRPPPGTTRVFTNVAWKTVMIVAIGPRDSQLTIYDPDRDQWASQDLPGMTGPSDRDQIWFAQHTQHLLPCVFSGSHLTRVALFDVERFQWSVQDLVEPREESSTIAPVVGKKTAVYVVGQHLYAYSSEVGRWDSLKLDQPVVTSPLGFGTSPLGIGGAPLTIENDVAAISQGGHLHVFAAKTGRWQTVEPKE